MTKPPFAQRLTRPIRDRIDGVTLRTRSDALRYIERIASQRPMTMPWHIARNLLRSASSAEAVTGAVELALKFEGRLEDGGFHKRLNIDAPGA